MEGMEAAGSVTPDTGASTDSGTQTEGQVQESGQSQQGGKEAGSSGGRNEKGQFVGKGGKAPAAAKPASSGTADDEDEEVTLGSVKGKVPKALAQAMKNYERGFMEKSREAAQLRREREEEQKLLASDKKAFLKKFGIDPEEFAEMTLAEKLELAAMSPEEIELRQYRAEKAAREQAEKEAQEVAAKEAAAKEESEAEQTLSQEIADAWKESGLPKDLFFVKQMAALMRDSAAAHAKGRYPKVLTAKEAASIVKGRFEESLRGVIGKMDPEGIHRFLGEERFSQLREWDVKRATSKAPPTPNSNQRPASQAASAKSEKPKGPMNEVEWRRYMEKLAE
jgi:hypothetical protein